MPPGSGPGNVLLHRAGSALTPVNQAPGDPGWGVSGSENKGSEQMGSAEALSALTSASRASPGVSEERTVNFRTMSYEPSWLYEGGIRVQEALLRPQAGRTAGDHGENGECRMKNAEYKTAMPATNWLSWAILRREWDGLGKRSKAETLKAQRDRRTTPTPTEIALLWQNAPHTPPRGDGRSSRQGACKELRAV